MTTRAPKKAGVAKATKRCAIVGFAPTWMQAPWNDPDVELWGMNALHRVAGEQNWSRWYQLHDIELGHGKHDYDHLGWLRAQKKIPIFMWEQHIERYEIPNAVPFPKQEVLDFFGTDYFTNTVSWMIAHAIMGEYKAIEVYGVDMAQDALSNAEYSWQRPSCEFFLGWARGAGTEIVLPKESDLLKTPYLYGDSEGGHFRIKLESRLKELKERQAAVNGQIGQHQALSHQLAGAIEDTMYYLRAWSVQNGPAPSPNGQLAAPTSELLTEAPSVQ
jgi:hypothetical protein